MVPSIYNERSNQMSHNVETMAYSGERPWHSLGNAVSNDLTPEEMMIASGTNWTVSKHPMYSRIGENEVLLSRQSLFRDSDNTELDIIGGDDWNVTQNSEAFAFFKEFVERGEMQMETAGSLQNGKIVWVLAKVNKEFNLFNGDKVEGRLLFSNFHKYGFSRDIRFTPTRVVCNNTLTMALNGKADKVFKASHRVVINNEIIKETLGIVEKKMTEYEELATFLGSKQYNNESVKEFFNEVFPKISKIAVEKELSKNAKASVLALEHQPGVEFAPHSWWQAANAVTYVTDHLMGRTEDARVSNMWYGQVKDLKLRAMTLALDYANKS